VTRRQLVLFLYQRHAPSLFAGNARLSPDAVVPGIRAA